MTRGSNGHSPRTKYKRSKNAFSVTSIAPNCVRVCLRLLQLLAQSLIGSPGTFSEGVNIYICNRGCENIDLHSIALGVPFNLILKSQFYYYWSLFYGTWQKRPGELDHRLSFEI